MDYILLVQQAQHEDESERRAAFDMLIRRFQRMAFQQAYHIVQDVQLAEDAVQEASLMAYLRIHQLRSPEAFPTWFRRIVQSESYRMIRGKQRYMESIDMRYDLAMEKPDPEELLEAREIHAVVQGAIDALPPNERLVTEGFYLQGQSQKEIAENLQLPLTTVKKRLQYAREHLRLLVGDINSVVDQAIARILQPQEPQRQPIYIYNQNDPIADE